MNNRLEIKTYSCRFKTQQNNFNKNPIQTAGQTTNFKRSQTRIATPSPKPPAEPDSDAQARVLIEEQDARLQSAVEELRNRRANRTGSGASVNASSTGGDEVIHMTGRNGNKMVIKQVHVAESTSVVSMDEYTVDSVRVKAVPVEEAPAPEVEEPAGNSTQTNGTSSAANSTSSSGGLKPVSATHTYSIVTSEINVTAGFGDIEIDLSDDASHVLPDSKRKLIDITVVDENGEKRDASVTFSVSLDNDGTVARINNGGLGQKVAYVSPRCAFLNETSKRLAANGCDTKFDPCSKMVVCNCSHTTIFAVVLSIKLVTTVSDRIRVRVALCWTGLRFTMYFRVTRVKELLRFFFKFENLNLTFFYLDIDFIVEI